MTAQFSATCMSYDCCSFRAAASTSARISTRMDTALVVVSIFVAVIAALRIFVQIA